MTKEQLVIMPFVMGLLVSLVVTPVVIWIFKKFNLMVDPKKQAHPAHLHSIPIPKGGGIAIFLAVLVCALMFLKVDQHLLAILLGGLICVIVGVIDDIHPISPTFRLGTNFLVAAMVVGSGIGIAFVSNPMGGVIDLSNPRFVFELFGQRHEVWILANLFALIWIPFLMNAVNFSSGLDGQVSGVVAIGAVVIGVLSLTYSADITQWPVAVVAFALAGSFGGFAFFHFYPQKIMPGYSGTSLAGFLLAVLAILATAKVGTVLVVLGLPAVDAAYSMIRRVLAGKLPWQGDREHLHHKLLDMGWGKRRVALFYWAITGGLGMVALNTSARAKIFAILGLSVLIVGFFLWTYLSPWSRRLGHVSG